MKMYRSILMFSGIAMASVAFSTAHAGIAATKHNLSTTGTGSYTTDNPEICVFCHTPHSALKNDNIPLWNHTLSSEANYGVYTSPTIDGTGTDVGGVTEATAAVTNLCLSCHDGTVALNALNNPSNQHEVTAMVDDPGGTGKIGAGRATNLGSGASALKNDHPVNFTYNNAADSGLRAPVGDTVTNGANSVQLYDGKVQCASCHDPHFDYSVATGDPAHEPFLRVEITQSTLCLVCHDK